MWVVIARSIILGWDHAARTNIHPTLSSSVRFLALSFFRFLSPRTTSLLHYTGMATVWKRTGVSSGSGHSSGSIASPFVTLARCDSSIIKIEYIADSKRIAVASKSPRVTLFEKGTDGKPADWFTGHNVPVVNLVHLRQDIVASLDRKGFLVVWKSSSLGTEGIVASIQIEGIRHDSLTKCDSQHLAAQTDKGRLRVFNISYGENENTVITRLSHELKTSDNTTVNNTIVHRTKLFVASDMYVDIWNFHTGEKIGRFEEAVDHFCCSDKFIFIAKRSKITVRENAGNFAVVQKHDIKKIIKYTGNNSLLMAFINNDLFVVKAPEKGMMLVSMESWTVIGQLQPAICGKTNMPLDELTTGTILFDGKLCLGFSKGHCVIYKITSMLNKSKKNSIPLPLDISIPRSNKSKRIAEETRTRTVRKITRRKLNLDEIDITQPKAKKRKLSMVALEKEMKFELELQNRQLAVQLTEMKEKMKEAIHEIKSAIQQAGVEGVKDASQKQSVISEELQKDKEKDTEIDKLKELISSIQMSVQKLQQKKPDTKYIVMKTKLHELISEITRLQSHEATKAKDMNDIKNYVVHLEKNIQAELGLELKRANDSLQEQNAELEKCKLNLDMLFTDMDGIKSANSINYDEKLDNLSKNAVEMRMKLDKLAEINDMQRSEGNKMKSELDFLSKEMENRKLANLNTEASVEETNKKIMELAQQELELRNELIEVNKGLYLLRSEVEQEKEGELNKNDENYKAPNSNIVEDVRTLRNQVAQMINANPNINSTVAAEHLDKLKPKEGKERAVHKDKFMEKIEGLKKDMEDMEIVVSELLYNVSAIEVAESAKFSTN